jgi:hypothetical protein
VLYDNIDIKSQYQIRENGLEVSEIEQRQFIRVQLLPGRPQDEGNYHRQTTFSMFGTDRSIKSVGLDIHPIRLPADQEGFNAWGVASYTAETDFRNETTDDCIGFNLVVKPETFARYAAQIAHGLVDEMILRVGAVDGFYSEWSPSISTRDVKVLTGHNDQKITLPPGHEHEPPRLGHVGNGALYINRRLEFDKREPESEAVEAEAKSTADIKPERAVPPAQVSAPDPQMLQMLRSLRRAAWFVVWLLVLVVIVTLVRR